ncbi:MAG: UTP--glucose-1-phosphate uridylyltransferase [Simkaniaceae bacterium]|nr:UTP--glucose-1-phosphate uridylyltransferase [Simkaniaceae bacterium]
MEEIEAFLEEIEQTHLLKGAEDLSPLEFEEYKNQMLRFNAHFFDRQRQTLLEERTLVGDFQPVKVSERCEQVDPKKIGCVILAGGDGTRLGVDGPKGCVEVIKGKSLFRILIEKCERESYVAVITSPRHREAIERHFEENGWFGRSKSHLVILTQKMWPQMNARGNWVSKKFGELAMAPNGNGAALQELYFSETAHEWKEAGVEFVSVCYIDNPLAEPYGPFDPSVELTVKTFKKRDASEKVGLLADKGGRVHVIEYLYYNESFSHFDLAYSGMFVCSIDFLMRVSQEELPWHLAIKEGLFRFETHIYDLFPFATRYCVVEVDRAKEFAPLKNATGEDSLETVKKALEKKS